MSTFGTMKSRIADELSRSDLTTQIGYEILSAIKHYETQRWWFSEARATASTVSGEAYVALPSDFRDEDSIKITESGDFYQLKRRAYDWMEEIDPGSTMTGIPEFYSIYQEQLRLYPVPDDAYVLTFSYVKDQAALSDDADTNDWMVAGEELIRSRAKAAIRVNYLMNQAATAEMQQYAAQGFLCAAEMAAYRSLKRRSDNYTSIGKIEAYCL
jgi:hypothetical protein